MKKLFYFALLFAWSCGNQPSAEVNKMKLASENRKSEDEPLRLNNGERWMVDEGMKPFIVDSETILSDYIENQSFDYRALAAQLKELNSKFILGCTMKGEGHDEFHKWLYLHMALIKSLEQEDDTLKANATIGELGVSFENYHLYFQ